jgi:hypothetical protein
VRIRISLVEEIPAKLRLELRSGSVDYYVNSGSIPLYDRSNDLELLIATRARGCRERSEAKGKVGRREE